jgi:hypothetical protein
MRTVDACGRVILLAVAVILQPVDAAPSQSGAMADAQARAAEFDLAGAVEVLGAAGERGDLPAQIAAVYVRSLINARDASQQGGNAESLVSVRQAIGWLEIVANGRPGPAEIARLMLRAAAAAAQSEREEMRLYLESATRMEAIQDAAGLPGAPFIPAVETAGDLWLQVHRYDEARKAYDEATARLGSSMRILAGQAQAARGARDVPAACAAFRALLTEWGGRSAEPAQIVDARAYVATSCAVQGG